MKKDAASIIVSTIGKNARPLPEGAEIGLFIHTGYFFVQKEEKLC